MKKANKSSALTGSGSAGSKSLATKKSTPVNPTKAGKDAIDNIFALGASMSKAQVSEYDWDDSPDADRGRSAKGPAVKRVKLENGGMKEKYWAAKSGDAVMPAAAAVSKMKVVPDKKASPAAAPTPTPAPARPQKAFSPPAAAHPPTTTTSTSSSTTTTASIAPAPTRTPGQAAQPADEATPIESFSLSHSTLKLLRARGVQSLFPIQTQTYYPIRQGRDLIGRARTGQGKTLAFCLPIIELLIEADRPLGQRDAKPLVLIMSPTRELARQIIAEFATVAPMGLRMECVYGGTSLQDNQKVNDLYTHIHRCIYTFEF